MTGRGRWQRSWRARRADAVVLVGLSIFVTVVYMLVVLGGGVLIDHTSSPDIGLSVLATTIVALSFERLRARLEVIARDLLHGGRASPYETLSQFTDAVTGPSADARMAQVLAEGTGVQWAQVWLAIGESLVLAAAWPPPEVAETDQTPPRPHEPSGRRTQTVRRAGETLAVLRLQERDGHRLTPVEDRLFANLAEQAGAVLHGARLRAQLSQRLQEMSVRAEELRQSRERLVDAQDAERRRLERDIHDGAQQHLVALAVNLRLAQTVATRSPERAAEVLHEQVAAAAETLETLKGLTRGIYPPLLSAQGVGTALRSALSTSPIPVTVIEDGGRYPAPLEAAVYFCCMEAIANATKHSGAREITVRVAAKIGRLEFSVEDDGRGFDAASVTTGKGLTNLHDRVDTAGGRLVVETGSHGGTRVSAWVPTAPAAADLAVAGAWEE